MHTTMPPSLSPETEQKIVYQLRQFNKHASIKTDHVYPAITISREYGCEAFPLGRVLGEKLKDKMGEWLIFHRDRVKEISESKEYSEELMQHLTEEDRGQLEQYVENLLVHKPSNYVLYKSMAESVHMLTQKGRAIIIGSGGGVLCWGQQNVISVRLKARMKFRVTRVAEVLNISEADAKEMIEKKQAKREKFVEDFTNRKVSDPKYYHLIIDNEYFDVNQMADIIIQAMKSKKLLQ